MESNAPYIVVLEDDIVLAEGWMAKTLRALLDIEEIFRNRNPWIYLRLFYTETALSWTSDDFAYRNMPLVFALGITFALACLVSLRRFGICRAYSDNATIGESQYVC